MDLLVQQKQAGESRIVELQKGLESLKDENQKMKIKESDLISKLGTMETGQAYYQKQIEGLKSDLAALKLEKEQAHSLQIEKEKLISQNVAARMDYEKQVESLKAKLDSAARDG